MTVKKQPKSSKQRQEHIGSNYAIIYSQNPSLPKGYSDLLS